MKTTFSAILTLLILSCTLSCSKGGGGGGGTPPGETQLTITTTPTNGSVQPPAPGTTFDLNVNITSAIPSKGVTIAVSAAPDGSSTSFFTTSKNSTTAANSFSITGTPVATVCLVSITVTSLSQSSNVATASYRYSAK